MRCPNCKKDLTADFKRVYKIGIIEGERRLQVKINCLEKTHRQLFDELLRLDKEQPLESCCIRMSRSEAKRLVKFMLKHKHKYHAEKIRKLITSQIDKPAFDNFIEKTSQNSNH